MRKKTVLTVLLILAICLVGYFLFMGKFPNLRGVFTTYDKLSYDSIPDNNDTSSMINSTRREDTLDVLSIKRDSLESKEIVLKTENQTKKDTSVSKSNESIFHVNTSYEKIPDAQLSAEKKNMVPQHQVDSELFSELILTNEEEKNTLSKAFSDNNISYESILKLLTIAGQDILLKDKNHISQTIIDTFGDSDKISVIYIVDRKGNISYSSHKTLANSAILSSLKNINLESNILEISEINGYTWVSIPIFYTYGKIGNVLINIEVD